LKFRSQPKLIRIASLCALSLAAINSCAPVVQAQTAPEPQTQLRAFDPQPAPAGILRIWGDTYMSSVVLAWEDHFRRYHPEVRFENRLMGTDTAMPGLYTGKADIALLGRESNTTDNDGFLHTLQYRPLQLHLMTGSLDISGKSYAPVVFVHKDNPIDSLTLQQLDAVLGCGQTGQPVSARTWGDLGLTGAWKDKPLQVYSFDAETGTGLFLLHKLNGESRKMNWPIIHEYRDIRRQDGSTYDSGQQIIDALGGDPSGLAVSGMQYEDDRVKPLPLAATRNQPSVQATRQSLIDRSYPLARMTYAFVNQPPDQPVPPLVKEFLRFAYSEEGQRLIEPSSGFLPLARQDADAQILLLH
jgi:phosphate transport system substrate-binding protein